MTFFTPKVLSKRELNLCKQNIIKPVDIELLRLNIRVSLISVFGLRPLVSC